MSRSRRRTPICGITTADSDHRWKMSASRKVHRHAKQMLRSTQDGESLTGKRWELVNPWSSEKDGKFWFGHERPELMRK